MNLNSFNGLARNYSEASSTTPARIRTKLQHPKKPRTKGSALLLALSW